MRKRIFAVLAATIWLLSGCQTAVTEKETAEAEMADTAVLAAKEQDMAPADTVVSAAEEQNMAPVDTETQSSSSAYHYSSDWQNAYAAYLDTWYTDDGVSYAYGVYIDDINGDGSKEMVIAGNPWGNCEILYYDSDGLHTLATEVMSVWGGTWYNRDTYQIVNQYFFGHTTGTYGNLEYYVYDWDGRDYVLSLSLYRESGYYYDNPKENIHIEELGQAYINGEPVDNDIFEAKVAEVKALAQENFPFVVNTANPLGADGTGITEDTDTDFEGYLLQNLYY